MNEDSQANGLRGKNVVVIGGSKGLGRAIVAAAHAQGARILAVARQAEPLSALAADFPGVRVLGLDASDEQAPSRVFASLAPDILILSAGAIPHAAPLGEQTWEHFSRNWQNDVKISFDFVRAALNDPLPAGAIVILIASGAAIGGSPLSGGYAGSKRMQMFLAEYAQHESDRLGLGVRFFALLPGGMMPETDLGKVAVAAYAASMGIRPQDFIERMPAAQSTEEVAHAVLELAVTAQGREGTTFQAAGREAVARP